MIILLEFFWSLVKGLEFLFFVETIAFFAKLYFLFFLITKALRSKNLSTPLYLLLALLFNGAFGDFVWIIKLFRELWYPLLDYSYIVFFIRLGWAFNVLQFQSLSLFVESLVDKKYKINLRQKTLLVFSFIFSMYFFYSAFFHFDIVHGRSEFEFTMMNVIVFYVLFFLILPSIFLTLKNLYQVNFPKILKKQLTILVTFLLCPYLLTESIQTLIIVTKMYLNVTANNYLYCITSVSTLLLTFAIYHAMRKVMGLRFLNFQNHVQAAKTFNFIDDFKNVLEKLSYTNSVPELSILTQLFFKDAFGLQANCTNLYIRSLANHTKSNEQKNELSSREVTVERCINGNNEITHDIVQAIKQHKILIYDEIVFNNFYQENKINRELIQFLERINAAIFLPIYEHATLIAYIIVERDGRSNEFFSNVERDEMLVFASYLGNIIHLLQNRNLTLLIAQEKELREELFQKHQEINQYKESIRTFLRSSRQRKIGILFYKNRRFTFGNQAAKELINVDLNAHMGHSLAKVCKQLVEQVENYKATQHSFGLDAQGNKLILVGIPSLEHNTIIITVYYPEIADVIKKQIDLLQNPSEWDYLLYLETTKSGQLINQLIPGSGSQLLNFKIGLLKIALSRKALLLQMPEADLLPTVEIIHHISLREKLQVVSLQALKNTDIAIQLFGINPLLGFAQKPSMLEQLHNVGTLFIQNIHLLDIELQEKLAEFIKYGYYTVYKGDQRIVSDVRIIASSHLNIEALVQEGRFSPCLFKELQKTTLSMPSIANLASEEMHDLVDGFTKQALRSSTFKTLLELTEREKNILIDDRPMSLFQFKTKIQQLLMHKSKKNNVEDSMEFDQTYSITDPALAQAARLGKKALKDPKIMNILWNKFKNQNKIAAFLGVNRSSINRRCKEYDLI